MSRLRRQLPVHSPITLGGIITGVAATLRLGRDQRVDLTELLRREYRAEQVVLCGSGTQALQLAIVVASRIVDSPAVLALPAYNCFDVATAAVGADASVTFYDIDPETLGPDLESLEQALKYGARIVVVAPLFGLPVDWDAIEECLAPFGALAIEDAAQGHGAMWRGKRLGSLGRLSVLSFGRGKGWTGGEGGALLFRRGITGPLRDGEDQSCSGAVTELRVLVTVLGQWSLGRASLYRLPASLPWLGLGETRYRAPVRPQSIALAAAALVRFSFRQAMDEANVRRRNAVAFLKGLRFGAQVKQIATNPQGKPGFLRLPLRLSRGLAGFTRPSRALDLGVASGYPSPLTALPEIRSRVVGNLSNLPGGHELVRTLVTVPTHSRCTVSDRDQLLRLLNSYASEV